MRAFLFRFFCRVFSKDLISPALPAVPYLNYRYGFKENGDLIIVHPENRAIH